MVSGERGGNDGSNLTGAPRLIVPRLPVLHIPQRRYTSQSTLEQVAKEQEASVKESRWS